MNDTDYLNSLLEQEKSLANQPTMIPIPSLHPQQSHENILPPQQLSRDPSPEEKIQMMGTLLGMAMRDASKADSDYIDLGNPQGFRERAAARQNLYKIAENLDKQREAIKKGQQNNLNPINAPVINEPNIPNFINTTNTNIVNQYQNKQQDNKEISNQLEFNFNEPSINDILNEIIKLNNKFNDLYEQILLIRSLLNQNKKKLK